MRAGRLHDQEGGASVFTFFVLLLMLLLGLGVALYAGRSVQMQSSVLAVAEDAARHASMRQNVESAEAVARQTVEEGLRGRHVPCHSLQITSDIPRNPALPSEVMRGAYVSVDVSCSVLVEDLTFVTFSPENFQMQAQGSARERVDLYRGSNE